MRACIVRGSHSGCALRENFGCALRRHSGGALRELLFAVLFGCVWMGPSGAWLAVLIGLVVADLIVIIGSN